MTLASIQWPQVSAIAAWASVIVTGGSVVVAICFQIKNLRSTRLSNSAKMVLDLAANFNTKPMRCYRRQFGKDLLENRSNIDCRNDLPVLQFFEDLGYMTRRGVLEKGMVWNSFFWYLEFYYPAVTASPNLLQEARKRTRSPSLYQEIEWLYLQLSQIDAKEEQKQKYEQRSDEDIELLLKDEANLDLSSS
jgi:hypothetical protein